METCIGCGVQIALAEADLIVEGARCRACILRAEVQGHVNAVAVAAEVRRARAVGRRAAAVARGHWIVWGTTVIIFCGVNGARHEAWFAPLALAVLVPLVGLIFKQRWAWRVLAGVDGATAAALFGWSFFAEGNARLLLLFLAAIPALLLLGLVLELRSQRTVQRSA